MIHQEVRTQTIIGYMKRNVLINQSTDYSVIYQAGPLSIEITEVVIAKLQSLEFEVSQPEYVELIKREIGSLAK